MSRTSIGGDELTSSAAWLRALDRLLPAPVRQSGADELRRARLTIVGCLVSFAIHAGTSTAMIAQGLPIVAAGNITSACLSIGLVALLRVGVSSRVVANSLVGVLLLFVVGVAGPTGGDANSALHTAAVLPGIAILLSGRRSGAVWVFIVCLVVAVLGTLRASGYDFPIKLDPERVALSKYPGVIALTLGVSATILLYEWVKDRALEDAAAARHASEVSEHERLQMELRMQENQRLESLGVLAGGVAHDFNNLLTTILGNATLIGDATTPAESNELADEIAIAARQAGDLTDQLLAYAGRRRSPPVPVDLSDSVRRVDSLIRTAVKPDVDLQLQLASSGTTIIGDPGQIQQVVLNLVTNAAQALEGAGRIEVTTGILADGPPQDATPALEPVPTGPSAFLAVEDDGSGMSEAVRSRIFDPFFTTKPMGRGLGLSAVLGIVRSHGGTIFATSRPGEGTRVEVVLPIAQGEAVTDHPQPSLHPGHWGGEILVVDDDAAVRRFASRTLGSMGFVVCEAEDGAEALKLLRQREAIQLVLLDDSMPVMRGHELLEEMSAGGSTLPVVLSTGNPEGFVTVRSDTPYVYWLPKPYEADALQRVVAQALAGEHREATG